MQETSSSGRILGYVLFAVGAVGVLGAVAGSSGPASLAGLSLPGVVESLPIWRWLSLLCGWILLPAGAFSLALRESVSDREGRALVHTALAFLVSVAGLALLNYWLMSVGRYYGTAYHFPISVFRGPEFHATGLPFAVALLAVLWLGLRVSPRLGAFGVWGIALALIVLGNLGQGSVHSAFGIPLTGSGVHYYHEAIRIDGWREWLAGFNAVQESLSTHARTHPPFAVLLHHVLAKAAGGRPILVAGFLTLLSSLTVPAVRSIMREVGSSRERAIEFALLFAVVPAVNVYSAVSLDGVVAALSAALLLGLIMILRRGLGVWAVILFGGGLLLGNALTFAGLLLIPIAALIAAFEVVRGRRYGVAIALVLSVAVGAVLHGLSVVHFGYDHVAAYLTAWRLEQPGGLMALRSPAVYVMTRAEDVAEIALFASVGVVAVAFRRRVLKLRALDTSDRVTRVFLAAAGVLAFSFLAGAYRTGETARACLFIYPYAMLALRNLERPVVRALMVAAGAQTVAMQLFGAYFW